MAAIRTADHRFARLGSDQSRLTPGVRLNFQHLTSQIVRHAQGHLGAVDGTLLPQGLLDTVPAVDLYEDCWVYVVSSDSGASLPMTSRNSPRVPA
ncbi:hypothetical protein [Streptomyces sp. NPDC101166]|uniref:hypothetical protein n=1 Tax=Streptomyces sp. NPDC101166 TaxID=3366120 RepID=UPI003818506E